MIQRSRFKVPGPRFEGIETGHQSLVTGHASSGSAAADGHHDLEPVAVGEALFGMPAARDDFAVTLERNALTRQIEPGQQLEAIERRLELPALAVDGDRDHAKKYSDAMQ